MQKKEHTYVEANIKGLDRTHLNLCRVFYLKYPQICATVSRKLQGIGEFIFLPAEITSDGTEKSGGKISATASHKFETPPETLISRLSFSHIREIMSIDDPFERFFYEFECIKGTWSVRELRRQIASNLYFRAGISKKPEQLLDQLINNDYNVVLNVREPMALEFLGIDAKESVTESDLEQALKDHLQEFMLELGRGFCFVARQKLMRYEDEDFYLDLVFYHSILKCHVLIDLKIGKLTHGDVGQMDSYIRMFDALYKNDDDNPTIGIILCSQKNEAIVKYSVLNDAKQVFASKYRLALPTAEELQREIEEERRRIEEQEDTGN